MPPTAVSQIFIDAKKAIDESHEVGAFTRVIAGLDPAERASFARFFSDQAYEARQKEIEIQRAQRAMPLSVYVQALMVVNFSEARSVLDFVYKAQATDRAPPPEPIVLAPEADGVGYQLQSRMISNLEPATDLKEGVPASDVILELRSSDPKKPSRLRYVFFLGALEVVIAGKARSSPFRVAIDPVNRSIWLVLAPFIRDDSEELKEIPSTADTWSFLGVQAKKRESFDLIQIATWEEFKALRPSSGLGRPLFSPTALKDSQRIQPKLFIPAAEDVRKALEKAR